MGKASRTRAARRLARKDGVALLDGPAQGEPDEAEVWRSLRASLEATLEPHRGAVLTDDVRDIIGRKCRAVFRALRLTQGQALRLMRDFGYVIARELKLKDA